MSRDLILGLARIDKEAVHDAVRRIYFRDEIDIRLEWSAPTYTYVGSERLTGKARSFRNLSKSWYDKP